jgi:pimeloyl-ACP methyl ester carboxylesterase
MFARARDDLNIHFEATGSGPALVLLHGFGDDHRTWIDAGWIDRLKDRHRVIMMDLRGCGKSDRPETANAYSIERHCSDIDRVLEAVHESDPILWGWSLGATIAMHYTAQKRIKATIACGSYFGPIFSNEFVEKQISALKDATSIARLKAFSGWPVVFPDEMKNPFLIYTGTKDGNVVVQLRKQQGDIERAKGKLVIFADVDHVGLIKEIDTIETVVRDFIEKNA